MFEVATVLLAVDSKVTRTRYDSLDEALAVAATYRAFGFYARTYIRPTSSR